LARGLAALAVFSWHWRNLFFVTPASGTAVMPVLAFWYGITGFGHEAVMIFFVLSGFFITKSVMNARQNGQWHGGRYLISRLSRLYVVLIPALLLGAVWDGAGSALFGAHSIYGSAAGTIINFPISSRLTWATLGGNLFFLQDIKCLPFGSNGPLWSLSYEFWYYMLFPACVFLLARKTRWFSRLAAFVFIVLILNLIGKIMAAYFSIWLLGAVVALCPTPVIGGDRPLIKTTLALISGSLFLAWGLLTRAHVVPFSFWSDFLLGLSFATALYVLLIINPPVPHPLYGKVAKRLAQCSYTLYLVHVPALVFLAACLTQSGRFQPDFWHLALGALVFSAVFAYAYGVASLTEGRTEALRQGLEKLFGLRGSAKLASKPASEVA
jgi:peptidoglycan/LPS O-acetylase OafA/YrhL